MVCKETQIVEIRRVEYLAKTLRASKKSAQVWLYYLQRRYGKRFGLIRLLRYAVMEVVRLQAEQELVDVLGMM